MITDKHQIAELKELFPFLRSGDQRLFDMFMQSASLTTIDPGEYICHEGTSCGHLPLVTQGTARVFKLGENGREITLYRIDPGESCVLTASCILSKQAFPASAISETKISAVVIPAHKVVEWLTDSASWRDYIFGLVSQRLANVISVIEEVVFRRMDRRIADYICQHQSLDGSPLKATHQSIASDLGTSREVVSRILKDLESKQLVKISRGAIEVADSEGLRKKAEAP